MKTDPLSVRLLPFLGGFQSTTREKCNLLFNDPFGWVNISFIRLPSLEDSIDLKSEYHFYYCFIAVYRLFAFCRTHKVNISSKHGNNQVTAITNNFIFQHTSSFL